MTIMAIGEILLREVPETLLAGVQTGEFRIYGSIIRSVRTGRIAGHLQETSGLTSLASQLLTSPATLPLQGVGLGVDLLGHAATYVQNEQIKTAIGVLHNLQLGNAALGAAGIGVSVAGFAVLSAKIDRVETKLDSLSQRVDAIGRAVEHMLREKIADDFIRLRTATEQMDEGWHLSDAFQHWRHVANEAHALVNIFERRIYQMLDDDRSDTQAVEPMQEAMAMAIAMRVSGIPFAMVTLAFAQAGSVLVRRNSAVTGGEEGLALDTEHVPDWLVGVADTRNLYWATLVVLVMVYLVALWVDRSRLGHLARATRENELRVRVLGLEPTRARLIVFVIAAVCASLVGVAYMLLQSGTVPRAVSADLTITVLVIVVLGGVGFRWGAIVGGVIYTLLDQRLTVLANSDLIESLPSVLRVPLSEPLFLLGSLFILVVMFLPGGIAGTVDSRWRRWRAGRAGTGDGAGDDAPDGTAVERLEDAAAEPQPEAARS